MIVNMIGRRQTASRAAKVLLALLLVACSLSSAGHHRHRRRRHHHQDHQHRQDHYREEASHQDSAGGGHHRELSSANSRGEQIKSGPPLGATAKWRSNPLIEWGPDDSISGSEENNLDARLSWGSSSAPAEGDFCSQAEAECHKSAGTRTNPEEEEEEEEKLQPPIDDRAGSICASDGRFYRSLCQLKRHSCRAGRALAERPRPFCQDASGPTSDLNGGEEVCDLASYERFKWLLWRHHGEDVAKMFQALDRNSDGLIEAHELWPRAAGEAAAKGGRARRSSHCPDGGGARSCENQLDFPFEPKFAENPCSLSHLVLFELRPPRSRLNFEALRLAFMEQLESRRRQLSPGPDPASGPSSLVELELGQSALLACPRARTECAWSRHNVSLGDPLKEPHLSLAGGELRIADAQLHLSGPYRCACQSVAPNSNGSEHLYYVQVSGAPRVELRPEFQWAPPGSRASFQCHHDHIDTSPAPANLSTRIRWLRDGAEIGAGAGASLGAGRLDLERLRAEQSGRYACQVELAAPGSNQTRWGRREARLLVQEAPLVAQARERSWLWVFHDEGVSVYKLQPEEQEMALASEISGHQQVSAEVDGNWNQLTLCGGLNPEQVVICEWSDNAVHLEAAPTNRSYVYVGQPNLNRLIVFEAASFELVAIVNTEPQPRRLYPYRPRGLRLGKWARRRASALLAGGPRWPRELIEQHDIWLLCYGQPLVVEPAADDAGAPLAGARRRERRDRRRRQLPFTPRLSAGWWAPADELGLGDEARLRSRKSVHVIQSTFLAANLTEPAAAASPAAQFKASSWLNTLHVAANFHLIQDLHVPARPYAMQHQPRHRLREAYVSRQRRLSGLSMEGFRHERDIDLHDCDPIHLLACAQGSLVLQCRRPGSRQRELTGQLLLDQLTGARLAFEGQVRAQAAYLSPDNRYLISVYTGESGQRQSIIYVQAVRAGALKLEYEIKTSSLEISQCAFVWKDGYYAAIFVSLNKRDQQSEILSLRLADGRLELMARVPGLVGVGAGAGGPARNPGLGGPKEQLVVSPELRLAALTTSQGTYVVDLEDNRVSQSLRRHQSLPTLLWASTRLADSI